MLDAINILKVLFAKQEQITVVRHGPTDAFGYARCLLSDDSWAIIIDPCIGYPFSVINHPPKIVPCAHQNAWLVTPWQEDERLITSTELIDMVSK